MDVSPQIPGLRGYVLALEDQEAAELSEFGAVVAAPAVGALVAAPTFQVGEQRRGAVVPFTRKNGEWLAAEFVSPSDVPDGGYFAGGVAAHGAWAAISDPISGGIWLFEQVGDAWKPAAVPVLEAPSDPPPLGFGRSVALSDELLVVAASTVVYVAERTQAGWGELQPLPRDPALDVNASYGNVATFGGTVVVGLPYPTGAVYAYEREDWTAWTSIRGQDDAGATAESGFGFSLALDDKHLFVGAPGDELLGSVFPFERSQDGWKAHPKIVSRLGSEPDRAEEDQFGHALALAFGRIFVGAPAGDPVRMRVQAFDFDPPNDEAARLLPGEGVNYFGSSLASSPSSLLIGSSYQAYIYVLELGAECSMSSECESGHCARGVCCETACEGGCYSCLAGSKVSGPSGVCGPVRPGAGPNEACDNDDFCGNTGFCDGSGQCAQREEGTLCEQAKCASTTQSQGARACDGLGRCTPATTTTCRDGYTCADAVCRKTCEQTADCASDFWCLDGACVTGRRCSEDRREAYDEQGSVESCDTVLCSDGRCPDSCEGSDDCVAGFCHPEQHRCVEAAALEPASATSSASGCSCRAPGTRGGNLAACVASLLLFGLFAVRRACAHKFFD